MSRRSDESKREFGYGGDFRTVFALNKTPLDQIFFPVYFTLGNYKIYIIEVVKLDYFDPPMYNVVFMIEGPNFVSPVSIMLVRNTEEFVENIVREIDKLERTRLVLGDAKLQELMSKVRNLEVKMDVTVRYRPFYPRRRFTRRPPESGEEFGGPEGELQF